MVLEEIYLKMESCHGEEIVNHRLPAAPENRGFFNRRLRRLHRLDYILWFFKSVESA